LSKLARGLLGADSARLLLPLLALKAGLLLLVVVAFLVLPPFFSEGTFLANFHWPPGEALGLATTFKTWDAQGFLFLSANGYQRVAPEQAPFNAYYPLWPWLIRATAPLAGGSHLLASLVLANLLAIAALVLLHRLVAERWELSTADGALLLMVCFPSAFFLGLPYSEALFLFLTALLFLCLRKGWLAGAAASAFLLSMTRAVGLYLVLPLAVHLALERRPRRSYLLCVAPVAGFAAYLLVMQLTTGDAWTGFHVYRHFVGHAGVERLFDPLGFWNSLTRTDLMLHGFTNSLLDRCVFLLVVATLPAVWRLDRVWFAYAVAVGLAPAMANSFMSYTRYALVCFPCFIAVAKALDTPGRRPWVASLALLGMGLQVVLLLRHCASLWVG